jgi:hypothetical protein
MPAWPANALDALDRAFTLLCRPPHPLSLNGRAFGGLPQRSITLDELRTILLNPATSRAVRDDVWRELLVLARGDQPAWVVAAAGIALPGLRRAAASLGPAYDCADLDAELLAGFLQALRTADPAGPYVCGRLIAAGHRAALRLRDADVRHTRAGTSGFWSAPPTRPWDHPDLVLVRAVAAGVVTAGDAALIASTRLDQVPLVKAAAAAGISVVAARQRRRRAEHRLAAAIACGDTAQLAPAPAR